MKFRTAYIFLAALVVLSACNKKPTIYDGRIYYTVRQAGDFRIEWMDETGGNVHYVMGVIPKHDELEIIGDEEAQKKAAEKLTQQARHPSVSRDGMKMAYLCGSPASIRIYDLALDKEELNIDSKESYYCPRFSPLSNTTLVYMRTGEDKPSQILVHDYTKKPVIIRTAKRVAVPCWSNYNTIYYVEYDATNRPFLISSPPNEDGNKKANRKIVLENVSDVAVAPSGSQLAVVLDGKLCVYDPRSEKTREVCSSLKNISSPSWNPAGTKIAFVSDENLYVVDAMGDKPVMINDPFKKVQDVCWAVGF